MSLVKLMIDKTIKNIYEEKKGQYSWNEYIENLIEASGTVRLLHQKSNFFPDGNRVEVLLEARLKKNIERIASYNSKSVDEFLFLISGIDITIMLKKRREEQQMQEQENLQEVVEDLSEQPEKSQSQTSIPESETIPIETENSEENELSSSKEEGKPDQEHQGAESNEEVDTQEKVAVLPPLPMTQSQETRPEVVTKAKVDNEEKEDQGAARKEKVSNIGSDQEIQMQPTRREFEKNDQITSFEKLLEMENFAGDDRAYFFKNVHEFLRQHPELEDDVFKGLYISMNETVLLRYLSHTRQKQGILQTERERQSVEATAVLNVKKIEEVNAVQEDISPKNRMKIIDGIELMTFDEKDRIKNYEQLLWLKTAYQDNKVVTEFTDIVLDAIERKAIRPPEKIYNHLYITLTPELLKRHIQYLEDQSKEEEEMSAIPAGIDPIVVKTKIAGLNKDMFSREDAALLDELIRNVNANNAATFMRQLDIILTRNEIEDTAIHSLQVSLNKTCKKRRGLKKFIYKEEKSKNQLNDLLVQTKYSNLADEKESVELLRLLKEYDVTPQQLLDKLEKYKPRSGNAKPEYN